MARLTHREASKFGAGMRGDSSRLKGAPDAPVWGRLKWQLCVLESGSRALGGLYIVSGSSLTDALTTNQPRKAARDRAPRLVLGSGLSQLHLHIPQSPVSPKLHSTLSSGCFPLIIRRVPVGLDGKNASVSADVCAVLLSLRFEPGVCHGDPPGIWVLCRLLNDITRIWTLLGLL